jgi:hypothetical protein
MHTADNIISAPMPASTSLPANLPVATVLPRLNDLLELTMQCWWRHQGRQEHGGAFLRASGGKGKEDPAARAATLAAQAVALRGADAGRTVGATLVTDADTAWAGDADEVVTRASSRACCRRTGLEGGRVLFDVP